MHNGDLICRKVTGITDETDRSYIYLDETIPRNITTDNHFIIGRTLVGRFDQNQLSIDFSSQGIGITPLKLKENYRVYDSWTPIDGIHLWNLSHPDYGASGGAPRALSLTAPYYGDIINTWYGYPFGGSYDQIYYYNIYWSFNNVTIPKGVTVIGATVSFLCYNQGFGNPYKGFDFAFSCANYDTSPTFTSVGGWKALARTTAVNWSIPNGTIWIAGERYTTPNLSPAFQQIVDRAGWVSGNRIMVCGDQLTDRGFTDKSWARPGPEGSPTHPRLRLEWI